MNDLVMAIADEEYGPLIREKRVFPPAERRMDERVARLTAAMREQGLLDETSKDGQRNLKRLGELAEHPGKLIDMEHDFLSEDQRRSNGEWIADDEYFIHEEAVHITSFLVKTYRRELLGQRIAIVMAKKIPPVLRRNRLGTATKLPGKMRYLSEWDALITLDWAHWITLTDKDRQRLLHHELAHLEYNWKTQRLQLRTHDFEDFATVVELYGLRSETEQFSTDGHVADILETGAAQLELLQAS